MVAEAQVDHQQHDGDGRGDKSEQLRHPDGGAEQVQAVGAQALDKAPAHAVPGKIAQEHLAVKLPPAPCNLHQKGKAQ